MPRFIDRLSEEDKAKAAQWAKERKHPRHETDIPPEFYTIAELGFYYGWGAVEAFYRGWIGDKDDAGKLVKLPFTLDMAIAFNKAAQKFHYRHTLEQGKITTVAMNCNKESIESAFELANKMRQQV